MWQFHLAIEISAFRSFVSPLKEASAAVNDDTAIVRIPRDVVEASVKVTTKNFRLGGRRPGWDLEMNASNCTLLVSGETREKVDTLLRNHKPLPLGDDVERELDRIALHADQFGS